MVDYGEFVAEALASSKDASLKTLGDKMDLIPWTLEDDGETSYDNLIQLLLDGTHAVTDSFSYIRYSCCYSQLLLYQVLMLLLTASLILGTHAVTHSFSYIRYSCCY